MLRPQMTDLARLTFLRAKQVNFAHIVSEFQDLLSGPGHLAVSLTWNSDDLITFETNEFTSALGWEKVPGALCGYHLTLAFGLKITPQLETSAARAADLRMKFQNLVTRLTEHFYPDHVVWSQSEHPPSAEAMDAMVENPMTVALVGAQSPAPLESGQECLTDAAEPSFIWRMPDLTDRVPTAAPKQWTAPIQVVSDLAAQHFRDQDLNCLRMALYPPGLPQSRDEILPQETLAIRIAAQTMNLTLLVALFPLGAALLLYSCLRGGDIRLSSQAMAISGLFMAGIEQPGLMMLATLQGI